MQELENLWVHVESDGVKFGWLCPMPHMTMASPRRARETTPIPPTERQSRPAPHKGAI
ncbi:MAG: hypothetical protein ACRDT8_22120 [Micromonosporaceae bacterium]